MTCSSPTEQTWVGFTWIILVISGNIETLTGELLDVKNNHGGARLSQRIVYLPVFYYLRTYAAYGLSEYVQAVYLIYRLLMIEVPCPHQIPPVLMRVSFATWLSVVMHLGVFDYW